jgi:hypothetical protein
VKLPDQISFHLWTLLVVNPYGDCGTPQEIDYGKVLERFLLKPCANSTPPGSEVQADDFRFFPRGNQGTLI